MKASFPIMAVLILCGVVFAVTNPILILFEGLTVSIFIDAENTNLILALTALIIPLIEIRSFLNRKSIILTFSLPVSRKSAAGAHYLCGLTYLLCFYLSILFVRFIEATCFSHRHFLKLEIFPNIILAYLLAGIAFYTIYFLIVASANNMFDAVAYFFMWQFCPILPLFSYNVFAQSIGLPVVENFDSLVPFNPFLFFLSSSFLSRLREDYDKEYNGYVQLIFILIAAAVCLVCYIAVFCNKKAQNIGGISTSLLGYKVMLPVIFVSIFYLLFFFLGMGGIILLPFALGLMILSYMIYRRSIKLKLADWLCMAAILAVAGILFAISQLNA